MGSESYFPHSEKSDSDPDFWPAGTVAVQAWLQTRGISKSLAGRQCQTGMLKPIGHGAYVRPGEEVSWTGALHTMQAQLNLPVHAGGQAALQLHHRQSVSEAVLFARAGTRLPRWFWQNSMGDWGVGIDYTATSLFEASADLGLAQHDCGAYAIILSSPERAMLEVLHRVPLRQSFDDARRLMEGLVALRPPLLQGLLETCRSVKVKRLFLYLADTANLPWFNELDVARVNLGSGKRMIVKGGVLVPRYNITVPK